MTKRKDAEDWLEWAQSKYDEAQERFAWMERPRSDTMDSYSTLISLIESGMAARAKDKADDQKARAAIEPMMKPLMELADQMETLGSSGFSFGPSGEVKIIPLGVSMKLPYGDVWGFVAYAIRDTVIEQGTRIAQFMPSPFIPDWDKIMFEEVESMGCADRGGYGSTGKWGELYDEMEAEG